MEICEKCGKKAQCEAPRYFDRFQRVYDYLQSHDGPDFLRQRLNVFLHINHCVAEGELDLIHNLVADHVPAHVLDDTLHRPGQWGIAEEQRQHMIEMGRALNQARQKP